MRREEPVERRRRRVVAWLGGMLLNLFSVLGALCIVLVILAVVFNISIIMFRTGSMSPTITAGSIAFVHEIPAQEIKVGDVITADRGPNVLPVTHRVIDILGTEEGTGHVTFEMRGDANEVKDPEPYSADTVRRVMFSVPGIAPLIEQFRNPFLLGGMTIAASLLVGWAFWPRREDEDDGDDGVQTQENPVVGVVPGSEPATTAEAGRTFKTATEAGRIAPAWAEVHTADIGSASPRSPRHALVLPAIVVLIAASGVPGVVAGSDIAPVTSTTAVAAVATSTAAETATATETKGQFLRMRAYGDKEAMLRLQPGGSATWTVDIWADAPDPGSIEVEIGSGTLAPPLAEQLVVDVDICPELTPINECRGGVSEPVSGIPLAELGAASEHGRSLLKMSSDEKRRVQVTLTLSPRADARDVAGQRSSVRVTAKGWGESVTAGPGDPGPGDHDPDEPGASGPGGQLPRTGISGWEQLLIMGLVLLTAGTLIVAHRRRGARS